MKLWNKCFCIFLLVLSVLLISCIFKPIPDSKSYYLYAGNWDYDEVFVIDTEDNAVIDTLDGFGHVWDIAITPGGSKLYVCTREGMYNAPGAVFSVDLKTKTKNIIINKSADVYISPNGVPLIVARIPHDSLCQVGFIDTLTNEIDYFDSLNIVDLAINYQTIVFDPDEPVFYAWTNERKLFAYDYDRKEIIRNYISESLSKNMVISKDGDYIYYSYKTLDIEKDSIIATREGYIVGSLDLSPNGEKLYLTDTGYIGSLDYYPSGTVKIFDLYDNIENGIIDINDASDYRNTPTDRMNITDDGLKAFISAPREIFIVDLETNDIIDVIKFEVGNIWLKPIVIGKKSDLEDN